MGTLLFCFLAEVNDQNTLSQWIDEVESDAIKFYTILENAMPATSIIYAPLVNGLTIFLLKAFLLNRWGLGSFSSHKIIYSLLSGN
ncbi:hypothetical protein [Paenibacillus sp. FSL L8-0499]|uniref:hypothetical protein n=1 Tax=Paenibacillus sp. FSL L8-0499 TaxID=2975334 RepID=UPI0030F92983